MGRGGSMAGDKAPEKAEKADKDGKQDMEVFDEDDEFEDFEEVEWISKPGEETAPGWDTEWEEAAWDDEDVDDSFHARLKAELAKMQT